MGKAPTLPPTAMHPQALFQPALDDLVVYILNVGDGDSIVIQFPAVANQREFAVVDSFRGAKSEALLRLIGADQHELAFICATHPHFDHISGLRRLLRAFRVREFWDSGFRYTSSTYNGIMTEVMAPQAQPGPIQFLRPTAGFETWINGARVSVLSPSISLRNKYDTYGIDPNNGSIVIRIEYPYLPPVAGFPAAGPGDDDDNGARSIILGGDAQTDAWSQVLADYPHLMPFDENWSRLIRARTGREPLRSDVVKVAHHGSKHGVNLELVERFGQRPTSAVTRGPRYFINSSAHGNASNHGFPHSVTQEILREVRQPISKSGADRLPDDELGIHYTAQNYAGQGGAAGSVAVVFKANGAVPDLYRFGDSRTRNVEFANARKVRRVPASPNP